MTTQANIVLTDTYNGPHTGNTIDIASSATSVTIGSAVTETFIVKLNEVRVLNPRVLVLTTQINTLTEAQILASGTTIFSTFTSTNPSTVNDNITINLPDPTVALEGLFFFFRKMRGSINPSTTNWTFTTPSARIVGLNTTANATGQPLVSVTQTGLSLRLVVCGYAGTYYWTFI